eukprot:TRINITY_DN7356_c0_g1_i1.p1 TRINITY_DN7356_c0_g1~~TRINITY_DN7356_c0_g1_i1.p1  ORF type:complete len:183 (-),score=23.16 TRINITY_DN7356_c0_g1_i1:297-845(-)
MEVFSKCQSDPKNVLYYRKEKSRSHRRSVHLGRSADFLSTSVNPDYYWFRTLDLFISCGICMASILIHSIYIRMFIIGILSLGKYSVVVASWPMDTHQGNLIYVAMSTLKCAQSVVLLILNETSNVTAYVASLLAFLAVLLIATIHVMYKRRVFKFAYLDFKPDDAIEMSDFNPKHRSMEYL